MINKNLMLNKISKGILDLIQMGKLEQVFNTITKLKHRKSGLNYIEYCLRTFYYNKQSDDKDDAKQDFLISLTVGNYKKLAQYEGRGGCSIETYLSKLIYNFLCSRYGINKYIPNLIKKKPGWVQDAYLMVKKKISTENIIEIIETNYKIPKNEINYILNNEISPLLKNNLDKGNGHNNKNFLSLHDYMSIDSIEKISGQNIYMESPEKVYEYKVNMRIKLTLTSLVREFIFNLPEVFYRVILCRYYYKQKTDGFIADLLKRKYRKDYGEKDISNIRRSLKTRLKNYLLSDLSYSDYKELQEIYLETQDM